MQIFYAPGIEGNIWLLGERESKHCIRVLRMKKDTPVRLVDGKGNLYEGVISKPDQHACEIRIVGVKKGFEKRPYYLHIAISPLKSPERFEWFVEKSVEIGVDEITPLICRNTEKGNVKRDRINNIIISAMKQSLKAGLTKFNGTTAFENFMKTDVTGVKLIAHCSGRIERIPVSEAYKKGSDAVILIGPEGDFSEEEISMAISCGFSPVNLGASRLRTETAGVAACHSIYFLNQQLF